MNYRRNLMPVLLLAAISLGVATTLGQVKNGKIDGHVTDISGSALQGAQVTVQPGGYSTVTGQQGEFSILDVATGDYTIAVSYVGFSAFTSKLTVTAGQVAKVDAVLQVAAARRTRRGDLANHAASEVSARPLVSGSASAAATISP